MTRQNAVVKRSVPEMRTYWEIVYRLRNRIGFKESRQAQYRDVQNRMKLYPGASRIFPCCNYNVATTTKPRPRKSDVDADSRPMDW